MSEHDGRGHSVLVVPVPELDAYVRARTAHYDPSFLSADPAFAQAHITLLGPWLATPAAGDLARVGGIVAATPAFETVLRRVGSFPDGLIHLRPEPDEPFRALTRALAAAFPQCPPYDGRFADPVPHLTLDQATDSDRVGLDTPPPSGSGGSTNGRAPVTGVETNTVSVASVAADLAGMLPVRLRVDRVDLQWWANDDCRVLHTWKLGV